MDPDERLRLVERHHRCDACAEVAAASAVALVPQAPHETVPEPRDRPIIRMRGSAGKSVTGQRWNDDVERRSVDSVRRRIGEQRHEGQVLDERARPAMREDQWDARSTPSALMDE